MDLSIRALTFSVTSKFSRPYVVAGGRSKFSSLNNGCSFITSASALNDEAAETSRCAAKHSIADIDEKASQDSRSQRYMQYS